MASGHSGHPSGERIWKQLKNNCTRQLYKTVRTGITLQGTEITLQWLHCLPQSDIPGHVQRRYLFLYPVCAEIQEPDHCVLYENSCRSLTNPQKQIKEKYGGRNLPNHLQQIKSPHFIEKAIITAYQLVTLFSFYVTVSEHQPIDFIRMFAIRKTYKSIQYGKELIIHSLLLHGVCR